MNVVVQQLDIAKGYLPAIDEEPAASRWTLGGGSLHLTSFNGQIFEDHVGMDGKNTVLAIGRDGHPFRLASDDERFGRGCDNRLVDNLVAAGSEVDNVREVVVADREIDRR